MNINKATLASRLPLGQDEPVRVREAPLHFQEK